MARAEVLHKVARVTMASPILKITLFVRTVAYRRGLEMATKWSNDMARSTGQSSFHHGERVEEEHLDQAGIEANELMVKREHSQGGGHCGQGEAHIGDHQYGQEVVHGLVQVGGPPHSQEDQAVSSEGWAAVYMEEKGMEIQPCTASSPGMPIIRKAGGWKKEMLAKDQEGGIPVGEMRSPERCDLFNLGRHLEDPG